MAITQNRTPGSVECQENAHPSMTDRPSPSAAPGRCQNGGESLFIRPKGTTPPPPRRRTGRACSRSRRLIGTPLNARAGARAARRSTAPPHLRPRRCHRRGRGRRPSAAGGRWPSPPAARRGHHRQRARRRSPLLGSSADAMFSWNHVYNVSTLPVYNERFSPTWNLPTAPREPRPGRGTAPAARDLHATRKPGYR